MDWSNAKAPQTGNSKTIERLQIKAPCDHKVRLIGTVLPRYQYWVVTKEGKKATIECLGFNRETQSFDGGKDPILEIPEGIFTEKPQFAYVCQLFHIEGDNRKLKICDLKQTIYKGIVDLVVDPEYGSPVDPEKGYDIRIIGEKTGPLPQNVKYKATAALSKGQLFRPLSKEEIEAELYNLDNIYKRPSYAEQKKWLLENTLYFAGVDSEASEGVDDLARG